MGMRSQFSTVRKVIDTNVPDWLLQAVVTREPRDARRLELDWEAISRSRSIQRLSLWLTERILLPSDPLYAPARANRAAFAPGCARPLRRAGSTLESLS